MNDLLAGAEGGKLQIHESREAGVHVAGLREEIVTSAEHVLALLEQGEAARHVGETRMNKNSSRSHTVFRMVRVNKNSSRSHTVFRMVRMNKNSSRSHTVCRMVRMNKNCTRSHTVFRMVRSGRGTACWLGQPWCAAGWLPVAAPPDRPGGPRSIAGEPFGRAAQSADGGQMWVST